jgi:hypothetical protein
MKCKDTRSPLITAAVLAAVLGSTAARAQTTPGAIPDPGTYQGSMQIQQEQDRQAQQYRQQSAPPFQQQPATARILSRQLTGELECVKFTGLLRPAGAPARIGTARPES